LVFDPTEGDKKGEKGKSNMEGSSTDNRAINLLLAQNVYSMATQVALKIFELSRGFPQGGPKSVRAKLISISGEVCSYLSEAWQNKNTRNVFIKNLNHASECTGQVIGLIQEAFDYDFVDEAEASKLKDQYTNILEKIDQMIENL
jgi:hypothetical protein